MPRTRDQLERAATDAEQWLDNLDPAVLDEPEADATDLRTLAATTRAVADGHAAQAAAVEQCRRHGKTWAQIADILGVSRQAARKTFGEPANR